MHEAQGFPSEIRVCLASASFYPLYAGPAIRFQRYARDMSHLGVRYQVFTQAVTQKLLDRDGSLEGRNEHGTNTSVSIPSEAPLFEVIDGLSIHRTLLPGGWRRAPTYFNRLADFCRKQTEQVEVVQFLNLDIWATPSLHRLKRSGISTVFTHTLLGDLSTKRWKRTLQRVYYGFPFNQVDCVVVSSGTMRRQLEALRVVTPIRVIPNGVDLQRFRPVENEDEKASLRKQLSLNLRSKIILAVGPVTPRKGSDALVRAFAAICANHPDACLVLVGPRHDLARKNLDSFRRQVQQVIASVKAQERVIFTGPVGNVQAYLKAADLLVFPSRREGMPNVVPEAMACGLPVIMTPFIGLPEEFGQPGIHYLLSDWNTQTLGHDIASLLSDDRRRRQLGLAARKWVELRLDVRQSIRAYAELYQDIRNQSRRVRR